MGGWDECRPEGERVRETDGDDALDGRLSRGGSAGMVYYLAVYEARTICQDIQVLVESRKRENPEERDRENRVVSAIK